jgi:hypothetical protein
MPPEKLGRGQKHVVNAHAGDRLYLWDSSFGEKQNLPSKCSVLRSLVYTTINRTAATPASARANASKNRCGMRART